MGDVDAYLTDQPADVRAALEHIADLVLEVAPEAAQGTSYGAPAFRHGGRPLLGFSAAKRHLNLFVFSPAVIKAREYIERGGIGKVLTVRSREAHSGPHEDWFWRKELSGGGALLDMGCHTIEAARYFFGKDVANLGLSQAALIAGAPPGRHGRG